MPSASLIYRQRNGKVTTARAPSPIVFDAMIHTITPVPWNLEVTSRWIAGENPKTYPTGLAQDDDGSQRRDECRESSL